MAQLGDTVVTGSLAVSNCIYGSATCATTANTASSATKLTTARKTYVTLGTASTTTTRDWSGDTTIPVNGTLNVANGGTGATTALGAEYNLIGSVNTAETDLTDSRYFALKNETVSASNGTFRWNKVSKIKKYTESNYWYGTCSTASATVAKTVTLSGFELVTNVRVTIKFTNANTATNATLNINSTGAKAIYYHGTNVPNNLILANTTLNLVYNGTQYEIVGDLDSTGGSSNVVTGVKGGAESTYRTGNVNITKSNLGLTTDEMGMKWNDSNVTSGHYYQPYCANGIWVIGNYEGSGASSYGIKYSLDGKTWNNSNVTSGKYYQPYCANGIWVIGGTRIKYSLDGKTWNDSDVTNTGYYQPYCANGIWVIGSGDGHPPTSGDGNGIKYSLDGIHWNNSNVTSGYFNQPYCANGIWVIGSSGAGIKYSLDGKTWSNSNVTSGHYYQPYCANGIWVIGSSGGASGNGIKYSLDGIHWNNSNVTSGYFNQPHNANGIWVIGSGDGAGIKYSLDGKTWNNSNVTSGYFNQPYNANGIWVISGYGVKYSLDGKTWNDSNVTSYYRDRLYYANGIWVIGGDDGIKYSTFNSLDDLGSAFKGITELSEKTTNLIEKTSSATTYYGICSTSRATNAKVVTCPTFKLEIGCKIIVKFTDTAGSAPTSGNISLNINETGAIDLYNKNYAQMTYSYSGEFRANRLCEITYDGTYYIWLNYDSNSTYSGMVDAYCSTDASDPAKVASGTNVSALKGGSLILVRIVNSNTSQTALTFNCGTNAKTLYINGSASSATNYTLPAGTYMFYWDGTNWYVRTDGKLVIPSFKASGSTAAPGLVPAPSTTAGTSKYLCEDGTWSIVSEAGEAGIANRIRISAPSSPVAGDIWIG